MAIILLDLRDSQLQDYPCQIFLVLLFAGVRQNWRISKISELSDAVNCLNVKSLFSEVSDDLFKIFFIACSGLIVLEIWSM